jgi:hypothetical protein
MERIYAGIGRNIEDSLLFFSHWNEVENKGKLVA